MSAVATAKDVDIALVEDGPVSVSFLSEQQVKKEITTLLGDEFNVRFVDSKRSQADWTVEGVRKVLADLYADRTTDIIVTLGPISSNEAAKIQKITKPTIAASIINPVAQSLPIDDNSSGKNNFAYIADLNNAGGEIKFFKEFVQKKKFAVLVEPFLTDSWLELKNLLAAAEQEFGITFYEVALDKDLNKLKQKIPQDVEAVMVGLLSQYNSQEITALADLLMEMKLPSYSFLGEQGVEQGFMVTEGQINQNRFQISRRIALDIQRILFGKNAKDLPVNIGFASRVVFNEATAYKVGFAPHWQKIINAKVINRDQSKARKAFTVTQAIGYALEHNLSLAANSLNVDLANKDLSLAKKNLYPQLSLAASYNQIGKDQVVVGANPEKRFDGQLNLSQSIYSESIWANYDISKYLLENQGALYQANMLDTAQQAATAYLTLLRTKADESIRISNLELTRKNLELAQNQMRIGTAGKSDVLRWRSQLATDRRNLFSSVANRQNAELDLAQVMNLPEGTLVDAREPDISSLLAILTDARFQAYVNNQIQWDAFQEFYKQEAIVNAPELKGLDSRLSASERNIVANKRGYYVPDVNLTAQKGRNFSQSGVGAIDGANKNSWTVGVQASLGLDINGQRAATISRSKLEKNQLLISRQATAQQIVTNTGKALYNIGSSYPSIQLTREAADAASESLELVQDSYAKGTVPISNLLDAQNNALNASLLAADAEYSFLQDYISLMRVAGDFKPILNGKYSSDWFDRLHQYFRQQGIDASPVIGVEK